MGDADLIIALNHCHLNDSFRTRIKALQVLFMTPGVILVTLRLFIRFHHVHRLHCCGKIKISLVLQWLVWYFGDWMIH